MPWGAILRHMLKKVWLASFGIGVFMCVCVCVCVCVVISFPLRSSDQWHWLKFTLRSWCHSHKGFIVAIDWTLCFYKRACIFYAGVKDFLILCKKKQRHPQKSVASPHLNGEWPIERRQQLIIEVSGRGSRNGAGRRTLLLVLVGMLLAMLASHLRKAPG
jgi:hypothetical protein